MNGETIVLTQRAQQQLMVLNALERGDLLMAQAADLLGLSVRQVRRLRAAYRQRGPHALIHGNRGRRSPRRVDEATRTRVIRLARTTYAGVNHQHLTELLAEREGLTLSHPTIHRILRGAGVPSPRRRRPPRHRRRRERLPQAGMLVQVDGSDHDWLEGRGPRLVLVAAVDDATGEVLAAAFRDEEDAHGYLLVLREIALTRGLPLALYSDRHGIFHRPKRVPLTIEEQLRGAPDPTQVGRVLQELSIRWIPAASPQAKGRIERLFGTFQDRLRGELRLACVAERDGANAFLAGFLPRYNARFTQPAATPTPAFRPWPVGLDPDAVFCFKYLRIVANDNTVTLGPHLVQILAGPQGRSYAKAPRRGPRAPGWYRGRLLPRAAPGPRPAYSRSVNSHPGARPPPRETQGATGNSGPQSAQAQGRGADSGRVETRQGSPLEADAGREREVQCSTAEDKITESLTGQNH